ncbi:la-related protein Larp4B-like [Pararge aegeria]|uniref:la-related protein Larp4B-like n=1 Tax=Pararge aegeria TaxID=116150 RepID=UPI0019D08019|nr:la-related protein Larp4B-like [Pararge aegeria]
MDVVYVLNVLVLVVLFVGSDAGGHEESHHDHINLHVPEFIHHDHHTKVITIHHHHHKPKKEHHHHHHHHHQKPNILHGPPKYHHSHHHTKSSSHSVSKGHSTHLGQNSHGNHGHKKKQGHSGHHGHHNYKHYETPAINYAPPVKHNPSPSFGSDYGAFSPSVPNIPSSQVHGVVHTVQQVKVFDSLPGAFKTGGTGYEVREQGDEGDEDVFTSVNSLSHSYPEAFGYARNAAAQQSDPFSDIIHSNTNQSPNTDPFAGAQPQPNYSNLEDFTIQTQSAHTLPSAQPSYAEFTGNDNIDNSDIGIGNGFSGDPVLSFAEAAEDDSPVSFSREAGLEHAINTGGIETVAY